MPQLAPDRVLPLVELDSLRICFHVLYEALVRVANLDLRTINLAVVNVRSKPRELGSDLRRLRERYRV